MFVVVCVCGGALACIFVLLLLLLLLLDILGLFQIHVICDM